MRNKCKAKMYKKAKHKGIGKGNILVYSLGYSNAKQ